MDATFALAFLEGVHWKQAAALFDQADIVVAPHGAQTSQALFMPRNSQFVYMDNSPAHEHGTSFVVTVRTPCQRSSWACEHCGSLVLRHSVQEPRDFLCTAQESPAERLPMQCPAAAGLLPTSHLQTN